MADCATCTNPYRAYRIGWWTHRWWPTRALVVGLITGNQLSRRGDNGSRFVGRRKFVKRIASRARRLRRPHRPWQAEATDDGVRFARRSFTAAGAERRIRGDVAHQLRRGEPSPWQRRRTARAVRKLGY